jgi:hypothetical protein
MADIPDLPPSPLSQEPSAAEADVPLPWVTLYYGAASGAAMGVLAELCLWAVTGIPRSGGYLMVRGTYAAMVTGIVVVAVVAADRCFGTFRRWLSWAGAFACGCLPAVVFYLQNIAKPPPWSDRFSFTVDLVQFVVACLVGGACVGWVSRGRSGLLWRLPLAGAIAALVAPAVRMTIRCFVTLAAGHLPSFVPWLGLSVFYVDAARVIVGAAFATALGLRAARRNAGAARDAPTEA